MDVCLGACIRWDFHLLRVLDRRMTVLLHVSGNNLRGERCSSSRQVILTCVVFKRGIPVMASWPMILSRLSGVLRCYN